MEWIRITPQCFNKYKENYQNLAVYAPTWGKDPYDIIYWEKNAWESLRSSCSDSWPTTYYENELYEGIFTHYYILKHPDKDK